MLRLLFSFLSICAGMSGLCAVRSVLVIRKIFGGFGFLVIGLFRVRGRILIGRIGPISLRLGLC